MYEKDSDDKVDLTQVLNVQKGKRLKKEAKAIQEWHYEDKTHEAKKHNGKKK